MNTSIKICGIKICGLSERASIQAALDHGVDMLGFIFFEKSPRNVSLKQAADLSDYIDNRAAKVAVTVDATDNRLAEIIAALDPQFLQLHGKETPARAQEISTRFGLPIIKAFSIGSAQDLENTRAYEGIADQFLLDAKPPKGADLPGGNGVSFDWRLLSDFDSQTDYLLSGGLDEDNIIEALTICGAKAVDLSSGVESAPGVKDVAKIASFIKTIRNYDNAKGDKGAPNHFRTNV